MQRKLNFARRRRRRRSHSAKLNAPIPPPTSQPLHSTQNARHSISTRRLGDSLKQSRPQVELAGARLAASSAPQSRAPNLSAKLSPNALGSWLLARSLALARRLFVSRFVCQREGCELLVSRAGDAPAGGQTFSTIPPPRGLRTRSVAAANARSPWWRAATSDPSLLGKSPHLASLSNRTPPSLAARNAQVGATLTSRRRRRQWGWLSRPPGSDITMSCWRRRSSANTGTAMANLAASWIRTTGLRATISAERCACSMGCGASASAWPPQNSACLPQSGAQI